jgi:hypothetical protein
MELPEAPIKFLSVAVFFPKKVGKQAGGGGEKKSFRTIFLIFLRNKVLKNYDKN